MYFEDPLKGQMSPEVVPPGCVDHTLGFTSGAGGEDFEPVENPAINRASVHTAL